MERNAVDAPATCITRSSAVTVLMSAVTKEELTPLKMKIWLYFMTPQTNLPLYVLNMWENCVTKVSHLKLYRYARAVCTGVDQCREFVLVLYHTNYVNIPFCLVFPCDKFEASEWLFFFLVDAQSAFKLHHWILSIWSELFSFSKKITQAWL